jgi:hypothetical protein
VRWGIWARNSSNNIELDGLDLTGTPEGGFHARGINGLKYNNIYAHHFHNKETEDPSGLGAAIWFSDIDDKMSKNIIIDGVRSEHNGRIPYLLNNDGTPDRPADNNWHDQTFYIAGQNMVIKNCTFQESLSGTDITLSGRDRYIHDVKIMNCKFGKRVMHRKSTPIINLVTHDEFSMSKIENLTIEGCDFYNGRFDTPENPQWFNESDFNPASYAPINMWRNGGLVDGLTIKDCRMQTNTPWVREWKPDNRDAEDHPQVTLINNQKNVALT